MFSKQKSPAQLRLEQELTSDSINIETVKTCLAQGATLAEFVIPFAAIHAAYRSPIAVFAELLNLGLPTLRDQRYCERIIPRENLVYYFQHVAQRTRGAFDKNSAQQAWWAFNGDIGAIQQRIKAHNIRNDSRFLDFIIGAVLGQQMSTLFALKNYFPKTLNLALVIACQYGPPDFIRTLIKAGANPDASYEQCYSPAFLGFGTDFRTAKDVAERFDLSYALVPEDVLDDELGESHLKEWLAFVEQSSGKRSAPAAESGAKKSCLQAASLFPPTTQTAPLFSPASVNPIAASEAAAAAAAVATTSTPAAATSTHGDNRQLNMSESSDKSTLTLSSSTLASNSLSRSTLSRSLFCSENSKDDFEITIAPQGVFFRMLTNSSLLPVHARNIVKAFGEQGLLAARDIACVDRSQQGNASIVPLTYQGTKEQTGLFNAAEIGRYPLVFLRLQRQLTIAEHQALIKTLRDMSITGINKLAVQFSSDLGLHIPPECAELQWPTFRPE